MSDYQYNPNVEQWKDIPGYPGYQVSDHGRVRSFWFLRGGRNRNGWIIVDQPQKIVAPVLLRPCNRGYPRPYLRVRLSKDGRRFTKMVHLLVLTAFTGPRPEGMQGCHNDGKPPNCHLINLRWDTPYNNSQDRFKHGTVLFGSKCGRSKLSSDQVIKIREMYATGLNTVELAKIFHVSNVNIGLIVRNKIWTHV